MKVPKNCYDPVKCHFTAASNAYLVELLEKNSYPKRQQKEELYKLIKSFQIFQLRIVTVTPFVVTNPTNNNQTF